MNERVYKIVTRRDLTSITHLLQFNLCEEAGEFYSLTLLNRYTRIPDYVNRTKKQV